MANSFTTQILEEGPRNVVMKFVGILDTSNLASTLAVDVSTLNCGGTLPTPTQVRIDSLEYDVSDQLIVQLLWDATVDVPIVAMPGRGEYQSRQYGGLTNNANSGKTGDINILTTGYVSGTQAFTLILEMVKQGPDL